MKFWKTVIENKDGTVSIEDRKERYTEEEFEKLKLLMPGVNWVRFEIVKPEQITNTSYIPYNDDED